VLAPPCFSVFAGISKPIPYDPLNHRVFTQG
jgi:hypothetical protein